MTAQIGDIWFRYYDARDHIGLAKLTVIKVTEKCVYLYEMPGDQEHWNLEYLLKNSKRVLQDPTGRRHAYPTRVLAAESYRIRKKWHRRHLQQAIDNLTLMESLMGSSGDIPEHKWGQTDSLFNVLELKS